jgi:hypothetical protein
MSSSPPRRPFRLAQVVAIVGLSVALAAVTGVASAGAQASDANTAKGTALVEQFFDLLRERDAAGLAKFLSPAFLLQGADGGVLDRDDFLANPSQVQSYDLSNVRVTRTGKVIVARYDVAAVVTINGVAQSRAPAPRLTVFVKGSNGWQMVAHANFNVAAPSTGQ